MTSGEEESSRAIVAKSATSLDALIEQVIGCAIRIHADLGPGYIEHVYAQALAMELTEKNIVYVSEHAISVTYRSVEIGQARLDFLVDGRLVVELKSVDSLLPIHTAQVISYLKMTGCQVGLLMNFNVPILKRGLRRVTHPAWYRTDTTSLQIDSILLINSSSLLLM